MKWFLKRLSEPSTAASISAITTPIYGLVYMGMPWEVAVPAILAGVFGIIKSEGVGK